MGTEIAVFWQYRTNKAARNCRERWQAVAPEFEWVILSMRDSDGRRVYGVGRPSVAGDHWRGAEPNFGFVHLGYSL